MTKKKLLLGLAPTRRFVFSAEDAAKYKLLVEKQLKCWDVEFVNVDAVNTEGLLFERAHAAAAAEIFKKANVDAVFAPHVNFGTEEVVCQLARAVNKPLLIWGPRDEAPLPDGSRLRDTQCGMFATANVLKKYGVPYSWIVNSRLDTPVFENGVKTFLSAVAAAKAFLGARIGQVSTRPPNFYTVMINEQDLIQRWGIEMVPIDLVVLVRRVLEMAAKDPRVKDEAQSMKSRVALKGVNDEALTRVAALKLFLADWAEKEELDAIAFKCHDDLPDALGIYPCFVNGELATMGVPVTCETDIHGALSALLLQEAARGATPPFFADLTVRHPTNDNAELLWHCGNFPHSLVKKPNAAFLGTHFVIPPHRPGTGNFEIKGGDITIARFDGIGGEYSLLMGHGRGTDGPFTLGTYLWVEVPDWPLWEERLVRGPYIHHVAGIHGKYAAALYEATRYIPGLKADPVQPTAEQIGAYLRGSGNGI
ncbi:MAG: L-fucose/L-arabinose isomerase family protein [Spirochaetia bacterium]|jgi:L-fucose isomerase-like protein